MKIRAVVLFLALACSAMYGTVHAADVKQPYAGQQHRDIKALSPQRIDGYRTGAGMGMAKAAELNHYPGPKHVLELAEQLQLSDDQIQQTRRLFQRMRKQAMDLGYRIVEKERALDRAFADGTITETVLKKTLAEIAALQGQLRHTHLKTHLAQKKILTPEQIHKYDQLRGYGNGGHHHHMH